MSFRLSISGQEVFIIVIYGYSRYLNKLNMYMLYGTFWLLVILKNVLKYLLKLVLLLLHRTLFKKKYILFDKGVMICVSSAKIFITKVFFF